MHHDEPVASTMAIMAHGLLGAVAVVTSAAEALALGGRTLDDDAYTALIDAIQRNGAHVANVLSDLVHGLDPDVRHFLDVLAGRARTSFQDVNGNGVFD